MTASVGFCLSYGPLKWDLVAFRMNIVSIRNRIVDMDVANDLTDTHQSVYDFYDMTFPLNNSDVI